MVCFDPLPVAAARDIASPVFVFEIPTHGLAHSALKCFPGTPAQLALNLTRVHGVTAVMAGTVLHKCDQAATRSPAASCHFVYTVANGLDNLDIALLVPAANVVSLSHSSSIQDDCNRFAMVLHIQPVANVLAIPINGKRLAVACVQNHQGY